MVLFYNALHWSILGWININLNPCHIAGKHNIHHLDQVVHHSKDSNPLFFTFFRINWFIFL